MNLTRYKTMILKPRNLASDDPDDRDYTLIFLDQTLPEGEQKVLERCFASKLAAQRYRARIFKRIELMTKQVKQRDFRNHDLLQILVNAYNMPLLQVLKEYEEGERKWLYLYRSVFFDRCDWHYNEAKAEAMQQGATNKQATLIAYDYVGKNRRDKIEHARNGLID